MSASSRRKASRATRKPAPRSKARKTTTGRKPARSKATRKTASRKRTTRTHDGVHPVLRDLPMLEFMPRQLRRLISDSFVAVSFPFGAVIVREGEAADALFVLASGRARAVKTGDGGEEVPIGVLQPGDTFGELGLLEDTTRSATVRASSELEALRLDRSIFQALLRTHPEVRESFDLHIRRRNLENFFRLYSAFASLPTDARELMLRELRPIEVEKGQIVVREGERPGPMYVVEEGRLRVFKKLNGRPRDVGYLRKGDFFGEVSVFKGVAREATVEAVTNARLLGLGKRTFDKLLATVPEFRAQIEERISQYDYRQSANVPLDFAEEILPADLGLHEAVGPDQVDEVDSALEEEEEETEEELFEETADEGFARPSKRIRRFPHVYQLDEMDCGAACLAMVARHFGRLVSIGHIRQAVGTSVEGTSLLGITNGAQALGLAARSVKASKTRLDEMPLPAVVHWEGNHWVVVYDIDRRYVRISDPAVGRRRMRRQEFEESWSGYAALVAHTPELEKTPVQASRTRWVWQFFHPYRWTIARAALLALVAAGLSMLLPVLTQIIIDRVVTERDFGLLNVVVISMIVVLLLRVGASIGQRYLLSRAAVSIDGTTLDFISGKLLALPMSYFHTRRTGDISRRLMGFRQAREFLVQQGVEGITSATQLLAAVSLMFFYSWRLALVYLAAIPAYLGLMRFSLRRLRPMYDSLEEAFGKYHSQQIDAIKGIETVKSIGAEGTLRKRLLDQFAALSNRQFRADLTITVFDGILQAVTFLSLAVFLWVGAYQVLDGNLTIGELVAFNTLVLFANGPLLSIVSMWDEFQLTSVLLNRLNDIFEQEPEQSGKRLRRVRTLEGAIKFQDVWFWYPGPQPTPILEGITFDVPPGTTVAIVGRSGSGKTTLAKCLAGLIEPTRGSIRYDGIDLKTLSYHDLRQRIGFVLQEPYLFDDTIAQNIAFGEETPDLERVERASRIANAHDFVDRLPLGYDTRIGESGILVSGGQRQRIAIARALYHRPPVLIFDEATSSLDTESERAVQENMDQLLEGRTSFVIAHRLSTIRNADMIVVLEKGKLVEQGKHDELMERRGLYYYLVSQQLGI